MNQFGKLFRINIFGESHGQALGIIIDGCPAGLLLKDEDFIEDFNRRKSGKKGTTPRKEADIPKIISGRFNDKTTGAPLTIMIENKDTRSKDYESLRNIPRPGHADFTAKYKYGGFEDYRGGGHFSGRITAGIVAAGVIAKKIINPVKVKANLFKVKNSTNIEETIDKALEKGDSVGGIIECISTNIPVGLGEPFFDSFESVLSHIIFAVPAIKGIEFGAGFASANMYGSELNDNIMSLDGKTETNNSGGINGGITNGNDIVFRVVVKPTSSISKNQKTFNMKTKKMEDLQIEGRHDTCIALRIPVVIEAVTSIVLADFMLQEQKIKRIIKN